MAPVEVTVSQLGSLSAWWQVVLPSGEVDGWVMLNHPELGELIRQLDGSERYELQLLVVDHKLFMRKVY